jgi:hypothetical protein
MANTKKHAPKRGALKKPETSRKKLVVDTFSCGCCQPVVSVDPCGCLETRILC